MGFTDKVALPDWKPWLGQKKALKFIISHTAAGLLLDPGFGKTAITLAGHKLLQKQGMADKMLIVAPMRPMQLVWQQEVDKWADFAHFRMVRIHSDYGKKEELIRTDADIYVINPEGLPWLMEENRWKLLEADTLCVDEISKFKHPNTARFKLLKPAIKHFARRWGLTGSPNPNGYLDLFGQAFILDGGAALGPYITHYRRKFFYPTGFGGYDWKLQEGAKEKIQEALKPLMLRLDVGDYIDVPLVLPQEIYIDLDTKTRKAYDSMEGEMFALLDTGTKATAVSEAAVSTKLRQIANGSLYAGTENFSHQRDVELIHDTKARALADLIEELQGQPVLVAYQFQHDLTAIQKVLGKDAPYIGGGVKRARAEELQRAWNAGELPYLLAQPQSVAHGLNLQNAGNHVAWYGLTWNYEDYDQFNKRVARQGSRFKTVIVHHIMARDTMETAMLYSLRAKAKGQQGFLDALKVYQRQRKVTGLPK